MSVGGEERLREIAARLEQIAAALGGEELGDREAAELAAEAAELSAEAVEEANRRFREGEGSGGAGRA